MPRKPKKIKVDRLHDIISDEFKKFSDPRALPQISLHDMLMSSFAIFSLKCPSLLNFEKKMQEELKGENLKRLYRLSDVPSDTQLRDVLDNIDFTQHRKIFTKIFADVQRSKLFEKLEFTRLNNEPHYLLALDGSGYFRSEKIKCENCMEYDHKNADGEVITKYGHNMLAASFVNPDLKQVISLFPEPIHNQDGKSKNDCEQNAFKRFIKKFKNEHPKLNVIFLLDALYATKPVIDTLEESGYKYIIAVKSTKSLMFMNVQDGEITGETTKVFKTNTSGVKVIKTKNQSYRFQNNVRLHQDKESPFVNFLDLKETISWEGKRGEEVQTKNFAYITNIQINKENLEKLCQGGRARWKIENETFNTLKNRGYHFEHNYGHGEKNLSYHFIMSMFLAFLIDQIQILGCLKFKKILKGGQGYSYIWETLRELIRFLKVKNWEEVYDVAIRTLCPNTS